jgi:hypothetical protein
MHTHMTIFWTIVLGIIGSIIGGAVTHMFARAAARTAPDRSTHEPDREQTGGAVNLNVLCGGRAVVQVNQKNE